MTFIDALSKENAKGSFSASATYGHAALLDLAKFPFESEESIMKKISTAGGARDDSALQHTELSQLKIELW
ncbi:hypothetical protein [Halomonas sp.]|uniref:hypothetical protein n=1 Tax=Halomonas sp. TaxID=1486246 RepID=UPI003A9317AE